MTKLHYFQTNKQKRVLYSFSLKLILINIIFLFSTSSYAQDVMRDPAQTLARCRNYLNSDQSIEKIAEDDQKVLELASCVEYGMDPPLKRRPEGGKTASKAASSGQLSNMQCPPFGSCLFGARTNRPDEQYYCCPEHTGGTVTSDMATGYYICQDEKGRNKQRVVNPLPGALVGEYFQEVNPGEIAIGKTGCNYKEDSYVPPKECCTIVPDDNSGRYYRCISWDTQAVQTFLEPPLTAVVNPAGQQCAW